MHSDRDEKYINTVVNICSFAAAFIAVFFIVLTGFSNHQKSGFFKSGESVSCLSEGWVLDDGEKQMNITIPAKAPEGLSGNTITLTNTLPLLKEDDVLMYRSSLQRIVIAVGGEEYYSYGFTESKITRDITGDVWVFVPLNVEDSGKEIKVTIISPYSDFSNAFNEFFIGSYNELYGYVVQKYGIGLAFSVILMILGLGMLLVSGAAAVLKLTAHRQAFWISLFSIMVASWEFIECKVPQLMVNNMSGATTCGYVLTALLVVPLIMYVDEIQQFSFHRVYDLLARIALANTAIQILLHVMGLADFHETMIVSHLIIVVSIIFTIGSFIVYYFRNGKKMRWMYFLAISVMLGCSAGEVGIIYVTGTSNGLFVGVAVLVFVVMCATRTLYNLMKAVVEGNKAVRENREKTMFLANMSHELRTPMNAICSLSEMLVESDTITSKDKESAAIINRSALSLLDIVNDILDYTRITEDKLELTSEVYKLNELIADCYSTIKVLAESKKLEININISPDVFMDLKGDAGKVKQILINLLNNGVKYTQKGSVTMNVDFELDEEGKNRFVFDIVDTGIGISEKKLANIFDAFSQTDVKRERAQESTGLGLAISRGIAKAMGGDITVESKEGWGSRFTVTICSEIDTYRTYLDELRMNGSELEYVDNRLKFILPKTKNAEENAKFINVSEAKIMVVDDNATNLKVMKEMMSLFGVRPTLISSGTQAIAAFRIKKFDLIFMDHMMPGLDGIETAAEIRKMKEFGGEEVKIIALTANVGKGIEKMFTDNGFDGYLSKPSSIKQLEKTLKDYLDPELVKLH